MLPRINPEMTPERNNMPTRWQTVIFRNYRMVPAERIANVLECGVEVVEREAARLGLRPGEGNMDWIEKGFVSVVRNNWYLLPYEQLMTLLEYTEDHLAFILEKEDFLAVKVGSAKPVCEKVVYEPLTEAQLAETERLAKIIRELDTSERVYFNIYRNKEDCEPKYYVDSPIKRTVHPYLTPCADPFIEDARSHLPDALLDDYARVGINSFVVHAVLATLSPFPYDPDQSRDYKIRHKNLKDLVERAGKRGISISLYLNEPRTVPGDKFAKYGRPELGGRVTADGSVSLCMQVEENRQWFYNAVKDLLMEIPGIGNLGSTNMGENPTHCLSTKRKGKNHIECPRCADLPLHRASVDVCNLLVKAVRDAGVKTTVSCSTWQWTDEMVEEGFKELDPSVGVGVTSEWGVKTNIGGIPWSVVDYSISHYGPSDWAKKVARVAKETGRSCGMKVQMACSWELAALPYLPLFDLELEHLRAVYAEGVRSMSLTWTLGSFPSITFDMASGFLDDSENFDLDKWYEKHFGENAKTVHDAVKLFCKGYKEYPFSCDLAYFSAKTLGVVNRWSLTPNNNESCMVNWTFDDIEHYAKPYPYEVLVDQFEKILVDWNKGCEVLATVEGNAIADELLLYARVAANHFAAEILHAKYVMAKRNLPASKEEMRAIFAEERALCRELLPLCEKSTMVGYEGSNHYFYTERDIIEKLVQLDGLERELDNM